jgi:hypothetical protein
MLLTAYCIIAQDTRSKISQIVNQCAFGRYTKCQTITELYLIYTRASPFIDNNNSFCNFTWYTCFVKFLKAK